MEDSDFNDILCEDNNDIEVEFKQACDYVQSSVNQIAGDHLLTFYGLYKIAVVGPCDTSKPPFFNIFARQKWNVWNDLGAIKKETAMEKYLSKLNEVEPDWNKGDATGKKKPSWVSVSTPYKTDDDAVKGTKSLIDHAKDGNADEIYAFMLAKLTTDDLCGAKTSPLNDYDAEGLGAIHWAADRGYANILKLLLDNGANVNLVDKDSGQTALHYAISCGHFDCIEILMDYEADPTITDSDDVSCIDLANESEDESIIDILNGLKKLNLED